MFLPLPFSRRRAHALAAALVACAAAPAAQAVCYVDVNAGGSIHDGHSWATAFTDLRAALASTGAGSCLGVDTEIWVKAGLYKPSTNDREASFTVQFGEKVYGGFAGTESSIDQRNLTTNPTILSGDIDGDDTDVADAHGVDRTVSANNAGNSRHVVVMDGSANAITASTVLDGFTITAGNAHDGTFVSDVCGGGFFCDGEGGGHECSPTLSNLVFSGNSAVDGGGVCNDGYSGVSSPVLSNVIFSGNWASQGGAIYNGGEHGVSSPKIGNATLMNNGATEGGAVYNDGRDGVSNPLFTNVTFSGNSATYGAGAVKNDGSSPGQSNPTLLNVTFSRNSATWGGALYNNGQSTATLNNAILTNNTATQSGPDIYNRDSTARVDLYYSVVHGDGCPDGGESPNVCHDGMIYADPLLGPLANYGGPMPTMLPAADSPAVDAGSPGLCPYFDERGLPRNDGHCDIGAVERQAVEEIIFIDGFDG